MFDSRGLPDYPPPRNAWQFPPPPVSPRWKWVAIAATVVGFVAGTSFLVVMIVVGSRGIPGAIDNPRLLSVIQKECRLMTSTVESMPEQGPAAQQASIIDDQNEAIEDMLDSVREVGASRIDDDEPAGAWLDDWERLVRARESLVNELLSGGAPDLRIPEDERGKDIHLRMNDAFIDPETCRVPGAVINPYPDQESVV